VRLRLGLTVGLALVVLLTACGIPVDHSPRVLDPKGMPSALVDGTPTTQLHESGQLAEVRIFLVGSAGSAQVMRSVKVSVPEGASIVSQATAVLQALIAYLPSSSKASAGLTNAVPSNLHILGANLDGNVLELDLSHIDSSVGSTLQRLAFAQMVFTATDLNGIDFVRFRLAGQPAQVQIDSGSSKAGAAISRADYRQLASNH